MEDSLDKGWSVLPRKARATGDDDSYLMTNPIRVTKSAITFAHAWMAKNDLSDMKFAEFLFNEEKQLAAISFTDKKVSENCFIVTHQKHVSRKEAARVASNAVVKKLVEYGYPPLLSLPVTRLRDTNVFVIRKLENGI